MENLRLDGKIPTLSQSSSRRNSNGDPNSPEFEFWMLRNPSFPQTNLHSADQLFVDGVLLPLHLLPDHNLTNPPDPNPHSDGPEAPTFGPAIVEQENCGESKLRHVIAESTPGLTPSKRWKDIFKKGEKKNEPNIREVKEKEKEKKRERKRGNSSGSAELNINIWPFSRSRSAGNVPSRPKPYPVGLGARKVNSAPCSRSNSSGESNSRKLPSSPARPGLYLGRSSPVWQARRGGGSCKTSMAPGKKEASVHRPSKNSTMGSTGKAKVISLNVPICMGYGHHLSCRGEENCKDGCASRDRGRSLVGEGGSSGSSASATGPNLFNLRSFFTKKAEILRIEHYSNEVGKVFIPNPRFATFMLSTSDCLQLTSPQQATGGRCLMSSPTHRLTTPRSTLPPLTPTTCSTH